MNALALAHPEAVDRILKRLALDRRVPAAELERVADEEGALEEAVRAGFVARDWFKACDMTKAGREHFNRGSARERAARLGWPDVSKDRPEIDTSAAPVAADVRKKPPEIPTSAERVRPLPMSGELARTPQALGVLGPLAALVPAEATAPGAGAEFAPTVVPSFEPSGAVEAPREGPAGVPPVIPSPPAPGAGPPREAGLAASAAEVRYEPGVQGRVLEELRGGPLTTRDLAARTGLKTGSVTMAVYALTRSGQVVSRRASGEPLATYSLTPAGAAPPLPAPSSRERVLAALAAGPGNARQVAVACGFARVDTTRDLLRDMHDEGLLARFGAGGRRENHRYALPGAALPAAEGRPTHGPQEVRMPEADAGPRRAAHGSRIAPVLERLALGPATRAQLKADAGLDEGNASSVLMGLLAVGKIVRSGEPRGYVYSLAQPAVPAATSEPTAPQPPPRPPHEEVALPQDAQQQQDARPAGAVAATVELPQSSPVLRDPEIVALESVQHALQGLSPAARRRVLAFVRDRYSDAHVEPPEAHERPVFTAPYRANGVQGA